MNDNYRKLIESTKSNVAKRTKAGRPKKLESEKKQYRRLSISVTEDQYKLLQAYADKPSTNDKDKPSTNYEGNISAVFRSFCRDNIVGFS